MNNFAALNNALVALTTDHTASEINDIFDDFMTTVPAAMVQPITAIKNDILAIINSGNGGSGMLINDIFHIQSDNDVIEAITVD